MLAAILIGGSVVIAAGIVLQPLLVAGVLGLLLVAVLFYGFSRLENWRFFLLCLGFILAGYATFGRSFAYLGIAPLYVGELVLVIGLMALAQSGRIPAVSRSPIVWAVLAFMAWGALQTMRYIDEYGLLALRDAATWGYGVFTILVATALLETGAFRLVISRYRTLSMLLLVVFPTLFTLSRVLNVRIEAPWNPDLMLTHIDGSPMGVHLAGIGAFLALGLHARRQSGPRSASIAPLAEWVYWALWVMSFAMVGTVNRSGMLAVFGALAVVFLLRPASRWSKVVLLGLTLALGALILNLEIGTNERSIQPRQLVENVMSIGGADVEDTRLAATREWRLRWWRTIVDYTVSGPYFWSGKGYGINLAVSDLGLEDPALRSPHNGHATILARSGVPGLALWIVLNFVVGLSLLRATLRARARGTNDWVRVNIWILAFWSAFLINFTFSVYLEGPYGGVWFWSLLGFAVVALELQRRESVRGTGVETGRVFRRHSSRHAFFSPG